jgi:hypothetical protein
MAHHNHFKPLFHPRLLAAALAQHPGALDEEQRQLAANWAASAALGSLLGQKEKPLQGQFLSEVFHRLLGYRQIVGSQGLHYLEPETSSKSVKGYKPPDARLGWFAEHLDRTLAVVELKAPGADLDARQSVAYGKLTPVEQAFGYAAKVDGCRWVVVSNLMEIRLYRTERGQGYCQHFELAELTDPRRLAEFVFLLGRDTLLGTDPAGDSVVEQLAHHTQSSSYASPRGSMRFTGLSGYNSSINSAPTTRPAGPDQRLNTSFGCWRWRKNSWTAASSSVSARIPACCPPRCLIRP